VWNNLRLLTRSDLVIVVWEYGGGSCLYFLEMELAYFWGIERYPFGGFESCLVSRVLEVLSSVELGINGPQSGSDHRHSGAQATQHDSHQRIPRPRQRYPDLDSSNRNSRDWRPEPNKEKYARDSRNQIRDAGHQSSSFNDMRGSAIEQDRARQHALKQKTSARPAFGECGKETLQMRSPMLMLVVFGRQRKG
jgi:hypothetical protein